MIASASPFATEAGLAVLRQGGNAVDAAVAVAMTLAVTYPSAGNLGGGGFMVARINGTNVALDFRETAPAAATRDMYLDANGQPTDRSVTGALAAGVPGSVAGLFEAHRKYGTRPWRELLQTAITLADSGFAIDSAFRDDDEGTAKRMALDSTSTALFLENGKFRPIGSTWRAPGLANVLRRIAERGRDGFYTRRNGRSHRRIHESGRRDHQQGRPGVVSACVAHPSGVRLSRASRRLHAPRLVRRADPCPHPRHRRGEGPRVAGMAHACIDPRLGRG
ncbi:MAG: gamma-glutamyltransferase [Gemmatimonadetes bacterium]|nr:gamma-glutamyltransferase [Gemmatimonadota bacterium]